MDLVDISWGKAWLSALGIWWGGGIVTAIFGGGDASFLVCFWLAVGFIAIIYFSKRNSKTTKVANDEQQKEEARVLVEKIKQEKRLEPIATSLFLDKEENAFLKENSVLMEAKAIRQSVGAGLGLRVAKGVYVGGYKGQSESTQELRAIDSGELTITNQKLVFRGSKENRVIPLSKIIEVKMHNEAIEIATTGRQKSSIFSVANPYIWNVNLFVLSKVANPLDFSGISNIDISIT